MLAMSSPFKEVAERWPRPFAILFQPGGHISVTTKVNVNEVSQIFNLIFGPFTLYFFEQKHGISTEENHLTYVMRVRISKQFLLECKSANILKKKLKSAGKNDLFAIKC